MSKLRSFIRSRRVFFVSILAAVAIVIVASFLLGQFTADTKQTAVSSSIPSDDALAKQYNKELLGLNDSYAKNKQDQTLADLKDVSAKRQKVMLRLSAKQPEKFLENAMPEEISNNLPAEAKSVVEKTITIKGQVKEFVEDNFEKKTSKTKYQLQAADTGTEYNLYFAHGAPQLEVGQTDIQAEVSGTVVDNNIVLTSADAGSIGVLSATIPTTTKTVAVVLMNFQNQTTQPYSVNDFKPVVFGSGKSVANYYTETSYGQVAITSKIDPTGDVYGWYTVPYSNNTTCDFGTWATAAKSIAVSQGVDFSGYTNVIYAFSAPYSVCNWGGLAYVNGSTSWANDYRLADMLTIIPHELGHNFGELHAQSLRCVDTAGVTVAISSNCTASEYGDNFDIMGGSYTYNLQMSGQRKGHQGWFGAANMQTVTASGTYTLAPIETASSGVQALQIAKDTNGNNYYLEYRQPLGLSDANIPTSQTQGVFIKIGKNYSTMGSTQLIDATPETSSFMDPVLAVGKTFTDPVRNLTVKTVSVSATGAVVELTLGTMSCAPSSPSVALSPTGQTGNAGTARSYSVTVKNNDSACAPATYNLTKSALPTGWTSAFSTSSLAIASGSSASSTLTVTSPAQATVNETVTFSVTATNSSNNTYFASANGTYWLSITTVTCTHANPAVAMSPSTSPTITPGQSYTYSLAITNKDSSACASTTYNIARTYPSGWSANTLPATITLSPGAISTMSNTLTSPLGTAAGTYPISASAKSSDGLYSGVTNASFIVGQPDSLAPLVTLVKPVSGTTVSGRTIIVSATATDNIGVTKIEVYVDDVLKSTVSTSSVNYKWQTSKYKTTGSHTILIKAYDAAGNVGQAYSIVTLSV